MKGFCNRGWGGFDCTTPTCQVLNCQNGFCSAPETCSCFPGYKGSECELEDIEAVVADEKLNLVPIIVPIVVVSVLLVVGLIILIIFLKRNMKNRRFKPKIVEPKYQSLIFGDYISSSKFVYPSNVPSFESLQKVNINSFSFSCSFFFFLIIFKNSPDPFSRKFSITATFDFNISNF